MLVVSLVLLSLSTITVDYRSGRSGPFETIDREVLTVVGAFQGAVRRAVHPVGRFFGGLARLNSLQEENARLKERLRQMEQERLQVTSVERQVKELSQLLDVKGQLGIKGGVTARVVGESLSNFEWSITVDAGSADGVRDNMPVLAGDGLVGHVVQVAPNTSQVQLIIDPDSWVAARLASSGETGVVRGQTADRDLIMDLVPTDARVFPNEQVLTAGYSLGSRKGLYPPDIVIGNASHVYTKPGTLTKTISVRPAVDFSALEFVLIVNRR